MRTYPKIGSTVTVTYRTRAGQTETYTGVVFADRYPDYALNMGDRRFPWTFVDSVSAPSGFPRGLRTFA